MYREVGASVCLLLGLIAVLASSSSVREALNEKFIDETLGPVAAIPRELDWRRVPNRVSEVSDQGATCNSGYAFAAAGLLEGQLVSRNITKSLVKLSAQQLVDCSPYGGCDLGITIFSLDLVAKLGGLEAEANYRYTGKVGSCPSRSSGAIKVVPKNSRYLPKYQEDVMKKVVAMYGPIAVSLHSKLDSFKNYKGGVFNDPTCTRNPCYHDHDVLVVGYGTDPKEGDYWLVKNSWGTAWGEQGYMRIKRGVNMCGLSHYPLMAVF